MSRFWSLLVLMSAIIIIDQLLKGYVQTNLNIGGEENLMGFNFFGLTYQKNFFSLFGDFPKLEGTWWTLFYQIIPFAIVLWLFKIHIKNISKSLIFSLGISLLIAGISSNLFDRYLLRYVLDTFFLKLGSYASFNSNVAELASVLGLFFIFSEKIKKSLINKNRKNISG